MLRILIAAALALALSGCDTFGDYRFTVKDPTREDTVREPTYYDYSKRDTVHPQSGSHRTR